MKHININMMRTAGVLLLTSMIFSSCFKKFDPDSYAPPLNIGGFTSANEIGVGNLIGYWNFNGQYNDSISGDAGTNTGTTFTNGIKGQALQGALNSYVTFDPGASITGMNSFTLTYWVNSPAPSTGIIGLVNLSKTDGFWGNIDMFFENNSSNTNGILKAHIQNGPLDSWVEKSGLVNLFDSWIHIALSYDAPSETFKLYVNGSPIVTKVHAGFGNLNFTNPGPMVFGTVQFQTDPSLTSGSGNQGWASWLTGQMDEVRLYNIALEDKDVNALMKLEGRGK
jgi:hypothetical protein